MLEHQDRDRALGCTQAATLLGIHPVTVRIWARRGWIPGWRTEGGHLRFSRAQLQGWKQDHVAED